MKRGRLTALLLTALLILSCSSCSQHETASIDDDDAQSEFDLYSDTLGSSIRNELYYPATVEVGGDMDELSIRIYPYADGKISDYGETIYRTKKICEKTIGNRSYTFSIIFQSHNTSDAAIDFIFKSSVDSFGMLIDCRSGSSETSILSSANDLVRFFPALQTYINLECCPEEDIALYRDVMDALNDDFSKSEAEIIAAYADDIGKSADELTWFMHYMLEVSNTGRAETGEDTQYSNRLSENSVDADPAIFGTPASVNGYENQVFKISGRVTNLSSVQGYSVATIDTDHGEVCAYLNNELIAWANEEFEDGSTGWANWHRMRINDPVSVYLYYEGFSDVLEHASGIFLYVE